MTQDAGIAAGGRMILYIGDTDPGAPNNLRGWMVRHEGACAKEVLDTFGTDTLPTPFLPDTPASKVRATLLELNPDVDIVVEVARCSSCGNECAIPAHEHDNIMSAACHTDGCRSLSHYTREMVRP